MEVIVDDTHVAGDRAKKGRCPLGRQLLGWKIDIKSEEEKRQESIANAAGGTGCAVTVLVDNGLDEKIVES